MQIKHTLLLENIHLLEFENQYELASTFLRFQEHYESTYFKGKYFTLEEFKMWYVQTPRFGKIVEEFTYYTDWGGFNIPSEILNPFREGKFDPLSEKEKRLLQMFENISGKFYIIGVYASEFADNYALDHETAHGLFYTNAAYREEMEKIVAEYDTTDAEKYLIHMGYHPDVLTDEIQAYGIDLFGDFAGLLPEKLTERARKVYRKYKKIKSAIILHTESLPLHDK